MSNKIVVVKSVKNFLVCGRQNILRKKNIERFDNVCRISTASGRAAKSIRAINNWVFIFLFALVQLSCSNEQTVDDKMMYPTIDYLQVRKHLDTLNAALQAEFDSTGTYSMPYIDISNGDKRIVFFGCAHTRDLAHPQFAQLKNIFQEMKPEIAFNEGGQIPESKQYTSIDLAVQDKGETGCLKYLCDSIGIKMMDGDMADTAEFKALLKSIPKDHVYLYMATERFLNPFRNGRFGDLILEEAFREKFISYLKRSEYPLSPEEETYSYLSQLYKKHLDKDLNLDSLVEVHEFYLIDEGIFGKVGRATKEVRDQALLRKIDNALNKYDKVFVVFGGSHRIAVEPALKQIIAKKR